MADWRTYDDAAAEYVQVWEPLTAGAAHDLVELAEPNASERLLDVGTGAGVVLQEVEEATGGAELGVGVDPSVPMLEAARRARPLVRVVAADVIDLPFRDATFDVVTSNFVLHHFADHRTALFDMLRVLKRGGRMALSVWGPNSDEYHKTWNELVEAEVGPELLADAIAKAAPGRERYQERERFEQDLYDAGLRHLRVETREYRRHIPLHDLIRQLEIGGLGRFVRSMLGDREWAEFRGRAERTFVERFADPLTDFNDAYLALGIKPV
ncbi:MAG: class I SAM-dependent methyltransferase [Actinomycetota bacterium]